MPRTQRRPLQKSELVGLEIEASVGVLTFRRATVPMGRRIDAAWPELREPYGHTTEWSWQDLIREAYEAWCLALEHEETPVAIWQSKRGRIVEAERSTRYPVAYLEVHPSFRKTDVSTWLMVAIGLRARERECQRVVLGAINEPRVLAFYQRFGGAADLTDGWGHQLAHPLGFDVDTLLDGLYTESWRDDS